MCFSHSNKKKCTYLKETAFILALSTKSPAFHDLHPAESTEVWLPWADTHPHNHDKSGWRLLRKANPKSLPGPRKSDRVAPIHNQPEADGPALVTQV